MTEQRTKRPYCLQNSKYTMKSVAAQLGIKYPTFIYHVDKGYCPKPTQQGPRFPYYSTDEVKAVKAYWRQFQS